MEFFLCFCDLRWPAKKVEGGASQFGNGKENRVEEVGFLVATEFPFPKAEGNLSKQECMYNAI